MDSMLLRLMRDLAYQSSDNIAKANAQGILSLLFNEEFAYPDDNSNARFLQTVAEIPIFTADEKYAEYLGDNYPNPFNGLTNIPYYLKDERTGVLKIYTDKGILIKTMPVNSGENTLSVNTKSWSSVVYFYMLEVEAVPLAWKKMVLIK